MRNLQMDMMQNALAKQEVQLYVAEISIRRALESGYERDRHSFFADDLEDAQALLRDHLVHLFAEYEDIWYVSGSIESEPKQSLRRSEVDFITRPFETMTESVYGLTLTIEKLESERDYRDVVLYKERHWPIDNLIRFLKREREYTAQDYIARHAK